MNKELSPTTASLAAALLVAALAACGDAPAQSKAPAGATGALAGIVVRGKSDGLPVAEAKRRTAAGQDIAIVGRIGGSEEPFAGDRAVFTVVDLSLKSCAHVDDPDHCATPWDYCCEDRNALRDGTATVEIAGADGRPLAGSVRGTAGLDPLAVVTVVGTVTDRNDKGLLVVRARRIEVH